MLECLKKQAYSDQKVASEEPFINIITFILVKKEPRQVLRMNYCSYVQVVKLRTVFF
jgi:hypothetical protein